MFDDYPINKYARLNIFGNNKELLKTLHNYVEMLLENVLNSNTIKNRISSLSEFLLGVVQVSFQLESKDVQQLWIFIVNYIIDDILNFRVEMLHSFILSCDFSF